MGDGLGCEEEEAVGEGGEECEEEYYGFGCEEEERAEDVAFEKVLQGCLFCLMVESVCNRWGDFDRWRGFVISLRAIGENDWESRFSEY